MNIMIRVNRNTDKVTEEYKGVLATFDAYLSASSSWERCIYRLLWCIAQLSHALTDIPVEGLRALFIKFKCNIMIGEKDLAYWLGHAVLYVIAGSILLWML